MDQITVLGLIAGSFTTFSFLPQLIKIIKTRSTKDISIGMFVILAIGIGLWIIYGIATKAVPIIAANSLTLVFIFVIIFLKLKYSKTGKEDNGS